VIFDRHESAKLESGLGHPSSTCKSGTFVGYRRLGPAFSDNTAFSSANLRIKELK
jgi:hypothetical protein